MNSHRISHTHLQFAQANATTKNCKRVCLANAQRDRRNEESQCVTKAIRNLGNVLIFKIISLNKICSKLRINCFKIPNYA